MLRNLNSLYPDTIKQVNLNTVYTLCFSMLSETQTINCSTLFFWSQGSSVSTVSDYELDDRGSRSRRFFSKPLHPDRLWGPSSLLYNGFWGSFPRGGKERPGCDANHLPPSSVEVDNEKELYLLSSQAPSWRVAGNYLYTLPCKT
jgi:hypothetical protein